MWNYSEKVLDHFMNPRNVGLVDNPDGVGEVGSMACGDALRLSFRLDAEGRIAEARFQTFGCGSAIASSSVAEAARITNKDIAAELDGLPREKMHCSVMGREALEAAMVDYFRRLGREVPCGLLQQTTILCQCFQVTKETVRDAIISHRLETIEDVTHFTKAGGGCTDCHHDLGDLLRDRRATMQSGDGASPAGGGLVQLGAMPAAPAVDHDPADAALVARIQELLTNEIGVALRTDGGDIEFVRYRQGRVHVRLTGSCAACRKSDQTVKGLVEARLREYISETIEVIEVGN
jgi:NifU-like protein